MRFCTACGAPLKDGNQFCTACGKKVPLVTASATPPIAFEPKTPGATPVFQGALQTARQLTGNTLSASEASGEMAFAQVFSPVRVADAALSPLKVIVGGTANIFKGFSAAFKDKKRWIPALVMALVWIVLTLLPLFGVYSQTLSWLSFLTFARGGMSGGIVSMVGGVIGKGVFAFFITSLLVPLFSGKNPFKNIGTGFSRFFGSFAVKNTLSLSLLLFGVGASFIAFNFMTGTNASINSMAGFTAFFVSLKALSAKTGFLQRLASSLTANLSKKAGPALEPANRLISGWAAGFVLSAAISFIPTSIYIFNYINYALGGLMLIAAVALLIASKSGKGATA